MHHRKQRIGFVLACALVLFCAPTMLRAAEPTGEIIPKLDGALKAITRYEYGRGFAGLRTVEELVTQAAKDPKLRLQAEKRLAAVLKSDATNDCKAFICRQLRKFGTAESVPALATLLTDQKLSHMARFALERNADAAAGAALREALGKTSGKLKAGMIGSLGARGDAQAVPALVRLIRQPDAVVAEAAVGALGRIGGADAAAALQAARPGASPRLRAVITDSLLRCADRFVERGEEDRAGRIYEKLYASREKSYIRIAALKGLAAARGEKAAPILINAIKSRDWQIQAAAIPLVRTIQGKEATKSFAGLLQELPPAAQVVLLNALADRGDTAAASAVIAAVKSQDEAVRIAALTALAQLGDASAVPVLAQRAAAGRGPEETAARTSLARLRGADVDSVIIKSMQSGEPAVRVELIRSLAARHAIGAVEPLLKASQDGDAAVRREALAALGDLAGERHLAALVGLLVNAKDSADRKAAQQAVIDTCGRLADKEKQAAPVLASLPKASPEAKAALIHVLRRIAGEKPLAAVRAALNDDNPTVRDAAIRALADWPDPSPAEDLLNIARKTTNQTHKVLALRGYIRMANLAGRRTAQQTTRMYMQAMKLAERPEDKKMVLAGLANAKSVEALQLVEQYLADDALKAEAALAAVKIADAVRRTDEARAKAALRKVLAVAKDKTARKQAEAILFEIDKYEGYITAWEGSGPYVLKGKPGSELLDIAFPPEKPDAKDVKWRPLTDGVGAWDIDLMQAIASGEDRAAYLRTSIWSPKEQQARLELGSDDGIKVWLNGKVVHANNAIRGAAPGQDKVGVTLRKGWNALLVKVTQQAGGWAVCARLRTPDGGALEGLKVQPGGQE